MAMVYLNVPWAATVYEICIMKFSFDLNTDHDSDNINDQVW